MEEIDSLNLTAEQQQKTIKDLEGSIDSLLKKREDQKRKFIEKEKQDKKHYNDLLKRYTELAQRVILPLQR